MFYIAKKFDWKIRIEKFDSEVNFELMSELHGKYADCKYKRLELAVEMYENANILMDTFHVLMKKLFSYFTPHQMFY